MIRALSIIIALISLSISAQNTSSSKNKKLDRSEKLTPKLRFHIMKSEPWQHSSGQELSSWVSKEDIQKSVMPQLNKIYKSSNIEWQVESIIEENIVKSKDNLNSIECILNATRDIRSLRKSLNHLYKLIQNKYKSAPRQLKGNEFHIYLFPFTGNTLQGTVLSHNTVVGVWSNKYTKGKKPVKRKLTEDLDDFVVGSLTQTIAHELGHVLGLGHKGKSGVNGNLMRSQGYSLEEWQIEIMRREAHKRIK